MGLQDFWQRNGILVRLIALNVLVFGFLAVLGLFLKLSGHTDWFIILRRFLGLPGTFLGALVQPWAFLSYAFVHVGFMHLLFNMLFLYYFGRILQEFIGPNRLFHVYILGTLAAGALFILLFGIVPYYALLRDRTILLGASGAVFAVVVGAATFSPTYTIFLIFIGPVQIKWIALAYVFLSFIGIADSNSGSNIAHVGGALMGYLYVTQLRKGVDLGRGVQWVQDFFRPSVTGPRVVKPPRSAPDADTQQAKMDSILDKISSSGYGSLSSSEKAFLFKMSKKDQPS